MVFGWFLMMVFMRFSITVSAASTCKVVLPSNRELRQLHQHTALVYSVQYCVNVLEQQSVTNSTNYYIIKFAANQLRSKFLNRIERIAYLCFYTNEVFIWSDKIHYSFVFKWYFLPFQKTWFFVCLQLQKTILINNCCENIYVCVYFEWRKQKIHDYLLNLKIRESDEN